MFCSDAAKARGGEVAGDAGHLDLSKMLREAAEA